MAVVDQWHHRRDRDTGQGEPDDQDGGGYGVDPVSSHASWRTSVDLRPQHEPSAGDHPGSNVTAVESLVPDRSAQQLVVAGLCHGSPDIGVSEAVAADGEVPTVQFDGDSGDTGGRSDYIRETIRIYGGAGTTPPLDHEHPVDPDRVAAARLGLIDTDEAGRLAALLSLIQDPVRSRVLVALSAADELCVGDLALALDATEDAVSYALKLLRTAGLVRNRKQGRVVYCRLSDAFPHQLLEHCLRQLLTIGQQAGDRS